MTRSKPVDSFSKTVADIEPLNFIKNRVFQNPDTVLDMNYVNLTYSVILIENGANRDDIVFIKSTRRNESKKLVASETLKQALREHTDAIASKEDILSLWKLVKKIRGDVLQEKCLFKGDFSTYGLPPLLTTFMKWVLLGPYTGNSDSAEASLADGILKPIWSDQDKSSITFRSQIYGIMN